MAALDASECVAALMQRRYCSVLRTADATAVASLADAYIAGGIEVVEFTMTCPHRFEHIKDYARRGDCLVGLGTCLTVDDAARGIAAGADFVLEFPTISFVTRGTLIQPMISINSTTPSG